MNSWRRLDGFLDHKNNIYILNDEYQNRNRFVINYIISLRPMILYGRIRVLPVLLSAYISRCVATCLRASMIPKQDRW